MVRKIGMRIRETCPYLSIKWNAFGTWSSPRWIRYEPTQSPNYYLVNFSTSSTAWYKLGAFWTRCKPWPVSRSSYFSNGFNMSYSAIVHSANIRLQIFFHSVKLCRTNVYWRLWLCVNLLPSLPYSMARLVY